MSEFLSSKDDFTAKTTLSDPAGEAVALADRLLRRSLEIREEAEQEEMRRMSQLIADPALKTTVIRMTDLFWRGYDSVRIGRGWRHILRRFGKGMRQSSGDQLLLKLGGFASRFCPWLVVPLVRERLRRESERVIIPADEPDLTFYLRNRRREPVRLNINQLGEAVLGEEEANRRLDRTLELLDRQDVNYVSVKISAIFSQINIVAWEATLTEIKSRLRRVYRRAKERSKFVNLDMEEYRDLELTVAAFTQVLDEPEFLSLRAGLVLQAYLPDSVRIQRELTDWALARAERDGAPIKIRLVKGANLAMEQVDAEWHGWRQAPFPTKKQTDAAFKRMLEYGCRSEHTGAVRLGVGSHNLFDVALAIVLSRRKGVESEVEIEMLEGMADSQARAVLQESGSVLLYTPIVREHDFGSALAYLVRRLDENTAPGNFLTAVFSMTPGSRSWRNQQERFLEAWEFRDEVEEDPRRATLPRLDPGKFANQPDSDWTLPSTRLRLEETLRSPHDVHLPEPLDASSVPALLEQARLAQRGWENTPVEKRAEILHRVADRMETDRFETLTVVRREGKKAVSEGDAEISEAVDFARYYARCGPVPDGAVAKALGVVVVTPPWNFPYAIPCGGVLAALIAGNAVVLKPAPEAVETGWHLANQLWSAGVPRDVFQCVICEDRGAGQALITDARTDAVILTGSWETAALFRDWRPTMPLFAETSGKNSIVVSELADRELAVKDIVRSAFSHSGQKCSAASLAILERDVYDDLVFRRQLRDAAMSLRVGPSADLSSVVTPLVQPPGEDLHRALTTLDEGESWLLEPHQDERDPCLWSPGIKLGVKPGSWFHRTECFGPVLGLMRARDLEEAVQMQNDVPFGLTAGFQSLDPKEIAEWTGRVEAGNLYINRGITGAIVSRQPFGGWKRSSVGPGAKAGGPNYVNLFRRLTDARKVDVADAAESYRMAWESEFSREHDPSALACESNRLRYRPRKGVILRLVAKDGRAETLARLAADTCGVPLTVSRAWEEPPMELAERIQDLARNHSALRTVGAPREEDVLRQASRLGLNWIDAPLSGIGKIELVRWLREQVVTETRHRYGNVFRDR